MTMEKRHPEVTVAEIHSTPHSFRILINKAEYTIVGALADAHVFEFQTQVIIQIFFQVVLHQFTALTDFYTDPIIGYLKAVINDILYPGTVDGFNLIAGLEAQFGAQTLLFYRYDLHEGRKLQ
jgi:hypothetical protein